MKNTAVGETAVANAIPSMLKLKPTEELIVEYARIFTMQDMDLGKTSLLSIAFKECHQCFPLSMYKELREHPKERLVIGVIWLSHSQWGSPVI